MVGIKVMGAKTSEMKIRTSEVRWDWSLEGIGGGPGGGRSWMVDEWSEETSLMVSASTGENGRLRWSRKPQTISPCLRSHRDRGRGRRTFA